MIITANFSQYFRKNCAIPINSVVLLAKIRFFAYLFRFCTKRCVLKIKICQMNENTKKSREKLIKGKIIGDFLNNGDFYAKIVQKQRTAAAVRY